MYMHMLPCPGPPSSPMTQQRAKMPAEDAVQALSDSCMPKSDPTDVCMFIQCSYLQHMADVVRFTDPTRAPEDHQRSAEQATYRVTP